MFEKGLVVFCSIVVVGILGVRVSQGAVALPKPSLDGKVSVEKTIQQRRTIREFKQTPLSLAQISQLLWSAQGVTDSRGLKRATPSGGALYPLDVYVVVGKQGVEGLKEGVYQYLPETHSISALIQKDLRREIASASLFQMWMASAPVICVVTVEYRRITAKYGDRGVRYALIEAGHAGQNLFIQAEALGLGAGIVGAFNDAEVAKVLGSPPQHEPILIMPVGYKK